MYTGSVIFDSDGNHLRKSYYWSKGNTTKKNFIFKDKLELMSISSKEARWKSLNTGKTYASFIGDLAKFVKNMNGGVIEGMFTFRNNSGYTSLIPTVFEFEDHTAGIESPKVISGSVTLRNLHPQF